MEQIKLTQPMPIYRQIVLQIEEMIKRGALSPGERIPSTFDFARRFNIANQTAQNALKELTNRGILKRVPRKGTFVSENLVADTIALFSGVNPFTDQDMAFSRLFCAAAFDHVSQKGWNLKLYFPQNKDSLFKAVSDLEKDISDGKIRAVFGLHPESVREWFMDACPVPHILFEDSRTASTMEAFTIKGLKYLRTRGKSPIAVVLSGNDKRMLQEAKRGVAAARKELAENFSVEYWLSDGKTPGAARTLTHEKLQPGSTPPDALFVLDDNIARGVIFALQEKGVRIPEHTSILTLSVKGVDILSPVPLTRIEYDPGTLARMTFDQLFDRLAGRKSSCGKEYHPLLIPAKSCGEQPGSDHLKGKNEKSRSITGTTR